ncbi:hypothetical protein [Bizionia myxarmorum]|uniref:DUF4890 domain-containing protein n=1 Tax=Bizionia myxarmorum TaxID=291186 RepID=A0A5D0R473_9FLAO|nr:hypothetical protein [Bizionia myxarmorum]TYB75775.1 hypothetical protein ES674_13185 [Bizionia myxarmorum]
MKKLLIIAIVLCSMQLSAQDRKQMHKKGNGNEKMQTYTPEERAQLQTKKLTLALDLNEAQQQQVLALQLENAEERNLRMEKRKSAKTAQEARSFSSDEKLQMKNARLDKQIAQKSKMKTILNDEQYSKWENFQEKRLEERREPMKHRKQRK